MTFWEAFFRVVLLRPTEAFAAMYWHLTRRRVRARNLIRRVAAQLPNAHSFWIRTREERPNFRDRLAKLAEEFGQLPTFEILLDGSAAAAEIERTFRSLRSQLYPNWRLTTATSNAQALADDIRFSPNVELIDGGASGALDILRSDSLHNRADYVLVLAPGDVLATAALLHLAEAASRQPNAVLFYADEDEITSAGKRANPWFKPQWNEELFLAIDYLSGACALDLPTAARLASEPGVSTGSDLLFALLREGGGIAHVPHIIVHRRRSMPRRRADDHLRAVSRFVEARGGVAVPGPFDTVKVEWPLPAELPMVSIIVPTRDRLELLEPCIESLIKTTGYRPYEVLIVDNGSVEPATRDYLARIAAHPAVRVLSYDRPYNYSAINNFAAREAAGAYLCLLNNDTEVVSDGWLTELMRYAVREDIGAAGAKLLYGNGAIQHAGVVIGMGDAAGHAHRFTRSDEPGYFRLPHAAHFVSAVTAACMVVAKEKFEAVGGLDEQHLAVAYNDVDLCLNLQRAGYRNVYVPHAVLLHHESMSRGDDKAKQHIARYSRELATLQERWSTRGYQDPLLNPNLDRDSETFIVSLD